MPRIVARLGRGVRLWAVFALVAIALAACGGTKESKDPTPTAMPMSTQAAVAAPDVNPTIVSASPQASPAASPIASPVGSPGATPIASGWTQSITRAEFQQQLFAAFPMESAAKQGGSLILGESSDISTLNPILASDDLTFQVVGSIFETLAGGSPIDGTPVPGLADSWDVSPDGMTYIFHISQTARWQDGVDVTADDVKFSFDAALNPNTGSSYTTLFNENIASYRVIDENTFEVTARDHYVSFLQNGPASIFIVPKHIWEQVDFASWSFDDGSTGRDASRVIGSGPFKFKEWVQGDHISLEKNPDYYGDVPNIDGVIFRVLPDTDGAVLALENGETDLIQIIPAADTERIQNNANLKVDIYSFYSMTLYMMNLDPEKSELFQDAQVRQALLTGLDRQSIKDNIFLGFGDVAVGTQPPLSPAYAPDQMTPDYAFDPEAAKQLLASAGWTDSNNDGVVDRDGKKMEFSLIYQAGDSTTNQIVSYFQEAWKQIGVKVKLEALDGNGLINALNAHDFDMAFLAFNLSTDGSQTQLFGCSQYEQGFNFMRYCNSQWDELDEQQKREFNAEKRTQLLIEQSQIIWADQGVGVIRFGIARTGYSNTLHNFHPNGYGFLWSLPYIWLDR
jgi:peptide/nickel transport system substrate-binding protein